MAKLRIQGDTSGYVDLEAPAAASGNTLDLDQIPQKNTSNTFTQDQLISGGDAITQEIRSSGNQAHFRMVSDLNNSSWMISNESNANRLRIMHTDTSTSTNSFPLYLYEAGYVTMPYQPAFHVSGVGQSTNTALANWSSVNVNRGNHFNNSNGRFTAPIDGVYHFFFFFTATDQSAPIYPRLDKNGSQLTPASMSALHADSGAPNDFGDDQSNSGLFFTTSLNAGDYVTAFTSNASTYYTNGILFGGHLLG
jgi:hypothetical protein